MNLVCPVCESDTLIDLGSLGEKYWVRCRDCGLDIDATEWWNENSEPANQED